MPESGATLPPLRVLVMRQLAYHGRLVLRTPRAVAGGVALPLMLLALRAGERSDGPRLVAGLAVLGLLSTSYITHASSLVAARQAGVLKRWRTAPVPAWCFFAGRISATIAVAVAGAALTIAAGAAFDALAVDASRLPALAVTLVVGAAAWSAIGTAATTLIPNVEAAWPLLGLSYLPIVVLSGSFGAVDGEPGWLAETMRWLPARPLIEAATQVLAGAAALPTRDLLVEVAWAVAAVLFAVHYFRWNPIEQEKRSA